MDIGDIYYAFQYCLGLDTVRDIQFVLLFLGEHH